MRGNPVGNQIRSLQLQLDDERKNLQMLLTAMESKAPDVFAEYTNLKGVTAQDNQNSQNSQGNQNFSQQGNQNFNTSQQRGQQSQQPQGRNPAGGGRF